MDIIITEEELQLFISLIEEKISTIDKNMKNVSDNKQVTRLGINRNHTKVISYRMRKVKLEAQLNTLREKLFEFKSNELKKEIYKVK